MADMIKLLVCLAGTFGAAAIGSVATTPAIATWYAALNKPFFNPPNWIFGPVWTILYLLMAVSAWLVWRRGLDAPFVKIALTFFILQLIFNALWSIAFFGMHSPFWAFILIIVLWALILLTIIYFYKIDAVAGWLMVPYICWVTIASLLNFGVFILN